MGFRNFRLQVLGVAVSWSLGLLGWGSGVCGFGVSGCRKPCWSRALVQGTVGGGAGGEGGGLVLSMFGVWGLGLRV